MKEPTFPASWEVVILLMVKQIVWTQLLLNQGGLWTAPTTTPTLPATRLPEPKHPSQNEPSTHVFVVRQCKNAPCLGHCFGLGQSNRVAWILQLDVYNHANGCTYSTNLGVYLGSV